MGLHLLFFSSHDKSRVIKFPSQVLSKGNFDHVELLIDNKYVVSQIDGLLYEFKQSDNDRKYNLTKVRLKNYDTDEVLLRLNELKRCGAFRLPYRMRDFEYMSSREHCARSLLKTGFTCTTLVAYLLGHSEYYKIVPDMIYDSFFHSKKISGI